jgi:hypothetical protein
LTLSSLSTPRALLGLAGPVALVVFVLLAPAPRHINAPGRVDGLLSGAALLRGDGPRADVVQDVVGARALIHRSNAYPVLGPAARRIGLDWNLNAVSTHPPTAFLFALPLAWLRWRSVSAVWAWLMVSCLTVAVWALGARWSTALVVGPLLLLWPPAAWSLAQLTPIVFLGQSLAWRWSRNHVRAAGASIGLAALTKLLPGLLLVPLLWRRRWRSLVGFGGVLGVALLVLLALDPKSIGEYLNAGSSASRTTIARLDNAALFPHLFHRYGALGAAFGALVVALVVLRRRFDWDAWVWLSVALLPIAWVYSLVPLAGIMFALVREKRLVTAVFTIPAIVLSTISQPFGLAAAARESEVVILVGIALALTRAKEAPTRAGAAST